ncbi:hypothetical protein [Streptomyces sp. NPDC048659]
MSLGILAGVVVGALAVLIALFKLVWHSRSFCTEKSTSLPSAAVKAP